MTRKTLSILLVVGLLLALALSAQARQGGPGSGYGPENCPGAGGFAGQVQNLTPEKQALFDKIMDEHQAKVDPLREDMWAKRLEYNALVGNPNADPARVTALVNEMKDLRAKLAAESDALGERLEKEVGITAPRRGFGRGMGMGMGRGMGMGPGHGMGMMGGRGIGCGPTDCPNW